MICAAIVLGCAGISLTFLPQEILSLLGEQQTPTMTLILQLMGAMYFAFAMVNWTAKENLLGGIYGRPIVIGNATHFLIGALALIKSVSAQHHPLLWIAAIIYSIFAFLFYWILRTSPAQKNSTE